MFVDQASEHVGKIGGGLDAMSLAVFTKEQTIVQLSPRPSPTREAMNVGPQAEERR